VDFATAVSQSGVCLAQQIKDESGKKSNVFLITSE
jgi:hypothetical protein